MRGFINSVLNELFRNFLFYSVKGIPDISLATSEEVELWSSEVTSLRLFIADHYPMLYGAWCQRSQMSLDHPPLPSTKKKEAKKEEEEEKEKIKEAELKLFYHRFVTPASSV